MEAGLNQTALLMTNLSQKSSILTTTSSIIDSFDTTNFTDVINSSSSIHPPSSHDIDWTDLVLALILCVLIVVSGFENFYV